MKNYQTQNYVGLKDAISSATFKAFLDRQNVSPITRMRVLRKHKTHSSSLRLCAIQFRNQIASVSESMETSAIA